MIDEAAREFRKFINSPVGKKLLASKLIDDVDPQYLLENYLAIAFKSGRESVNPPEVQKTPALDGFKVVEAYNEVFNRNIQPYPQRLSLITGRVKEARKVKIQLEVKHFKSVFEFKKKEAEGKEESWLDFETLCARKHFFKYLEKVTAETTKAETPALNIINQKLF